jgi:predicted small metal-binding protein
MPERSARDKKSCLSRDGSFRISSGIPKRRYSVKNLACNAVIPGCPFTASAETEEDLLEQVAAHAEHSHGVQELTPELLSKVKNAIQTDKTQT